ncbi:hypothetical protein T484DRAFT_1818142 [Baffinella frigidus]|nr:hypothetical protein T484DRAFT_1818142 [Cryptophyta sp. CCMP2293]
MAPPTVVPSLLCERANEQDRKLFDIALHAPQADAGGPSTGTVVELDEEYKKTRMRHLTISEAISPTHLAGIFEQIKIDFAPQKVVYNGGVEWANSCYMDVEQKMKPATMPHLPLKETCTPMLEECDRIFTDWYTKHHGPGTVETLTRLQSFITSPSSRG